MKFMFFSDGTEIQSVYLSVLRIIAVQVEIERLVNVGANNTNANQIKGKKTKKNNINLKHLFKKKVNILFLSIVLKKELSTLINGIEDKTSENTKLG